MVAINVAITLVNVAGYIGFWGLSLDTVVSIFLTIALGLAVDYSAHIAHAFMAIPGKDRNKRMQRVWFHKDRFNSMKYRPCFPGCFRNGTGSVQWRVLNLPCVCPPHDVAVLRLQELLQDLLSCCSLWTVPWTRVSASYSQGQKIIKTY